MKIRLVRHVDVGGELESGVKTIFMRRSGVGKDPVGTEKIYLADAIFY